MIIENTKDNIKLKKVITTLAVEDMYLSKDFVNELLKVSRGEKTSEQLRQEVIDKYTRSGKAGTDNLSH